MTPKSTTPFKTRTMRRAALFAIASLTLGANLSFAQVKAKIGHAMPDSHPQAAAMNKFAELASSYTNGNIKVNGKEVTVYTEPANVLHTEDVEDFSAEDIAAMLAD